MANKITVVESLKLVKGPEIFLKPAGTIWRVMKYTYGNDCDVVIVTDKPSLVSLQTGEVWGDAVGDYLFEPLSNITIEKE